MKGNSVSAFSGSTPVLFPVGSSITDSHLKDRVLKARGDINQIRMLLKGSTETCLKLFREAVQEGDAVIQIQLSHALFGMKWGKDDKKDFAALRVEDLEKFDYYPKEFLLFKSAYRQATEVNSDWSTGHSRAFETFRIAANRGYLPALLELKCEEWQGVTHSYGFAVQLKPFVGKGDRLLDYYFGEALKNGSQIGSESYYEGLYWMHQSCGIPIKYGPLSSYIRSYIQGNSSSSYYEHDGLGHLGGSIIAPSKQAWEAFVKEKLEKIKFAPEESYAFKYDAAQIRSLLNEHKIGIVHTSSFIESEAEGQEVESFGRIVHGFHIDSCSIYQGDTWMGEISVQQNTFSIYQTFQDSKIQPIIQFIEQVMVKTGSAGSAHDWLKQMGGNYI